MDNTQVITLMTFDTYGEAEVYRALLESAGVKALVENDILAGMFPTTEGLLKVRIFINKEDEKKAREILAAKFDEQEYAEQTHTKPKKKQA